ncbi:MAG: hypothetical protein JXB49_07385 [Bacteroidales bacterium]|nr:hypothetical protein [Bacteroidales bacterium]MBN2821036.1 hypothetical protein [Bacteroidales bacterium]
MKNYILQKAVLTLKVDKLLNKKIIILNILLGIFVHSNSQECEKLFSTNITYENSELGINYNNLSVDYNYKIFYRTNDPSLNTDCNYLDVKKPIIICEGYDIFHTEDPQTIYNKYINRDGLSGEDLRGLGYDIITFNLGAPEAAIQPNAIAFAQFITFINEQKSNLEENVVMGVSLGGIICRYALNYLENNNIPHNTNLFISFDSPHKGANAPLCVQALLQDIAVLGFAAACFGEERLLKLYASYMAKGTLQLMNDHASYITDGVSGPDEFHTSFYNELNSMTNALGFPKNCKKIAISDGSYNGKLQKGVNNSVSYSGNSAIIFYVGTSISGIPVGLPFQLITSPGTDNTVLNNKEVCVFQHADLCDATDSDGNVLYSLNNHQRPLDHSPGGKYPWIKVIHDVLLTMNGFDVDILGYYNDYLCFVPTISSLCLNTNDKLLDVSDYTKNQILLETPFDDIWWKEDQDNLVHTELTPQMNLWLVTQITGNIENYSGNYSALVSGTISESEVHKARNNISVSNLTVSSGGNLKLEAGNSLVFDINCSFEVGSTLEAGIASVNSPKSTLAGNLPNFNP